MFVSKDFRIWRLIGWQRRCQPIGSHVRKSLSTNMDFNMIFMPPPLGAGCIMFSGCPSVRPKPEIPSFHLYMGPLVHPTNSDGFAACPSMCPSVRPERFPGICWRTHGWNGLTFCMLVYLGHLKKLIRSWCWSFGFPPFCATLTQWNRSILGVPGFAQREWPAILLTDVSWPPSVLISLWSRSVEFGIFGAIFT